MKMYMAYGLGICSEIPLPELIEKETHSDVSVRLGEIKGAPPEMMNLLQWAWIKDDCVILYWAKVGKFLIRKGREVIVDPAPSATMARIRLFLLGGVLGILLHQRGYLVLHASGVEVDGKAVAFIGDKGQGKSTLAASLHVNGYGLLVDDVMAIDVSQHDPLVYPGFPQLKLWADSVSSIGKDHGSLSRLDPEFDKFAYPILDGFHLDPLPLQNLFILCAGADLLLEPLDNSSALTAIIPHLIPLRLGIGKANHQGLASLFLQTMDLLCKVKIYKLTRPQSQIQINEVAKFVEEFLITG